MFLETMYKKKIDRFPARFETYFYFSIGMDIINVCIFLFWCLNIDTLYIYISISGVPWDKYLKE